jgi:hypothetical protein
MIVDAGLSLLDLERRVEIADDVDDADHVEPHSWMIVPAGAVRS